MTPDQAAGFDGPIPETMAPRWAAGLGHPAHIKEWGDLRATYPGTGFTLSMAGGWAYGYGVAAYINPTQVTFAPPSSGTRWDTLVIRKDFTKTYDATSNQVGGDAYWKVLQGGSTRAVQSGGDGYIAGVTQDSAAYLVPVTTSGLGPIERIQVGSGALLYTDSTGSFPGDAGVGSRIDAAGRTWQLRPDATSGVVGWYATQFAYSDSRRLTKSMFGGGYGGSTTISVAAPLAGRPFAAMMTASCYVTMGLGGTATFRCHAGGGEPDRYVPAVKDGAYEQLMTAPAFGSSMNGAPIVFTLSLSTTGESVMADTQALSTAGWSAWTL